MNSHNIKWISVFLFCIFFIGCKKKKIEKLAAQLPEETQEGLNTFGCLINNEIWEPYINPEITTYVSKTKLTLSESIGGIYIEAYKMDVIPSVGYDKQKITLVARGIKSPGRYELIGQMYTDTGIVGFLPTDSNELIGGGVFLFSEKPFERYATGKLEGKNRPLVLNITRIDFKNKICSGTFSFESFIFYNSINIKKKKITHGRFDLKAL